MAEGYSQFLPTARRAALEAGRRILDLLKDPLVTSRKADKSLVTNADHAANDIIRSALKREFPKHAILSEETGLEGSPGAEYVWLIDPLDGTKAYAGGTPGFSVMIGLLHGEKPCLGVVYDPLEDRLYEAAQNAGSFMTVRGERRSLHVSDRNDFSAMPVITSTGFSPELQKTLAQKMACPFLDPINSVGIKIGYLVRQQADIYVNHHPVHHWDTCGPLVILEEAGGMMSDWNGLALNYAIGSNSRHPLPTIASNGSRHEDAVKIFSEILSR